MYIYTCIYIYIYIHHIFQIRFEAAQEASEQRLLEQQYIGSILQTRFEAVQAEAAAKEVFKGLICVAVCCSVLQYVAVCCSVRLLQKRYLKASFVFEICNTLQHTVLTLICVDLLPMMYECGPTFICGSYVGPHSYIIYRNPCNTLQHNINASWICGACLICMWTALQRCRCSAATDRAT